jgi:predicted transcriptional regulator
MTGNSKIYKPKTITLDDETLRRATTLAQGKTITLSAAIRICINQQFVAEQRQQKQIERQLNQMEAVA